MTGESHVSPPFNFAIFFPNTPSVDKGLAITLCMMSGAWSLSIDEGQSVACP
jgi:hypothetical protein